VQFLPFFYSRCRSIIIWIECTRHNAHTHRMKTCTVPTQFGDLFLKQEGEHITVLGWGRAPREDSTALLDEGRRQLMAYDVGQLEVFDLPLQVKGSDFQRAVCAALSAIPFGDTCTYGDIAKVLGVPAQSVGQACGGNPIPVIIPCHRVMGAKGLTGFSSAGGVETKVALLRHEKAGGFLI
jgi:methylated-DNA-[protein]-cysteine S-methyltransferase